MQFYVKPLTKTSGANLAKWEKEPCASYFTSEERTPGASSCCFDASYAVAHNLIYEQLLKPFHISFIHMSLQGAMFYKLSLEIAMATCLYLHT